MAFGPIHTETQINRFLETATGGIDVAQGLALARYASAVEDGDIVEIGSYKGKSAVAIAYGMGQSANSDRIQLFCIDPHATFTGQLGGKFNAQDRGDFFKVMLETGTYQNVALINLPCDQVALGWTRPIGMLFIDGDHRYHAVREDFMRWVPDVLDGGIIAIGDSTDPNVGPTQLVAELIGAGFTPIDRCEKITFYRKSLSLPQAPFAPHWRSILVVAEKNVLAGGLLRFSRLQRATQPFGIEISFAFERLNGPFRPGNCEILSMDKAKSRKWDATLLPGAGFSDTFLDQLADFQFDTFGTRVQCILNDQTREDRFLKANKSFRPHSVIFNTRAWTPGSYTGFNGDRFAIVEGAVDSAFFAPETRNVRGEDSRFVVGMQAKYLNDLAVIAPKLPNHVVFHVIRMDAPKADTMSPKLHELQEQGRLEFLGSVAEADLPAFYHKCDCILHLERFAGWANLVAEAMACGVPVVCSSPGTQAIADDGVTATVVAPDNADAVTAALLDVMHDPDAAFARVQTARERIRDYSWPSYAAHFLKAARDDGRKHYLLAPELGLHGKWPKESRLQDIDLILPFIAGSDILDIGCAEGLIALRLMQEGANSVHGFDIDPGRIMSAHALAAKHEKAEFRVGSVVPWDDFLKRHGDLLRPSYNLVLFLDVYQHLPMHSRDTILDRLLMMSKNLFAIRTPDQLFETANLHERITQSGFVASGVGKLGQGGSAPLRLYRKTRPD
jgi:2-polyprenyl-3-methyl-5-hydroxy-6-metoxy-1,4-benzoquinol methylase